MTLNREDLKAFVDGELGTEQSEAIRQELDLDNGLAQEVAFLKLIGQGVRECAAEITVQGAQETLDRVREKKRGMPFLQLVLMLGLLAMVSAFLFPVFAQSKSAAMKTEEIALSSPVKTEGNVAADTQTAPKPEAPAQRLSGEFTRGGGSAAKAPADTGVRSSAGRTDISGYSSNRAIPQVSRPRAGRDLAKVREQQSPSPNIPPISAGDANRMVIQNGDLDEVVRDASSAQNGAMDYVRSLGGFVESSSISSSESGTPQAVMSARIPARTFTMAMNHFKNLAVDAAHIKSLNVTGQDVTAQYSDVTARMRELQAEEDSYITMLKGARRLGEILAIKDRLSTVRQQIESYKSQSESLKNQSELSTINLTFEQLPKKQVKNTVESEGTSPWASDTWENSINGLKGVVKFFASTLIVVFVYSPIWIPLGLIGFSWYRRNN